MSRRHSSLVRRTRLSMLAVAAVSVVVVFVAFYAAWFRYTVSNRTAELGRQVAALATGLSTGGPLVNDGSGPTDELRVQLFRVQAGLIGARLAITDEDGAVVLSSDETATKRYDLGALGMPDERGARAAVAGSGDGRAVMVAVPIEGAQGGYLVAIQAVHEIGEAQQAVFALLVASALVATAVAWLIGGLLARRLSARILRLEHAAEGVAHGEWGRQVRVEGEDEVASLARSFNRMSSRTADAYRAQKEFVGDVSHELRTPITTIGGFAGALLDGTASEPEVRQRFLTGIRDEAARLTELTHTLLTLADVDSGRVELELSEIDVNGLREALRSRHGTIAAARGVDLQIDDLHCAVCPIGDEARLLQIASALLTNACAYTPDGGAVRMSSACEADRWLLIVDDSGPGVPLDERERVFERFVRLDPSRSADTGGSGLGLSICARLVDLMGGRIAIEDSPLGGARFIVSLPARA